MSLTQKLKRALWARHGAVDTPSEWDGRVYGGGKISQRFWEYFRAIELLDLDEGDKIIDIGGGSPATGLSFFSRLLADAGLDITILDINFGDERDIPQNVSLVRSLADRETLSRVLKNGKFDKMSCVSVLEHATREQQVGIFQSVQDSFEGKSFVTTFEFHERDVLFDQCLTTRSLSDAVSVLSRYYLTDIDKCPLHCENAFNGSIRLWYPMALRFQRSDVED